MDAVKLGTFISEQRKSLGMTQQELAVKINVTDKAVSRWERGKGLPDINIIEPLAQALCVSISELMKSEKISSEYTKEDASFAIKDIIDISVQKKQEMKTVFTIILMVSVLLNGVFLVDNMGFMEMLLVVVPFSCWVMSILTFVYAFYRKIKGKTATLAFISAGILHIIPVAFIIVLILVFWRII
ncbi:MAG: helix-turn-helix transcriptional regulator [Oscillospiraceae bacterium]|nr:helix-turn-helix transcriptional regulator [Oscillospiraceae bacterium]